MSPRSSIRTALLWSLLSRLPAPLTGTSLKVLASALSRGRLGRQARANLDLALPDLTPPARERTRSACFQHAARVASECLRLSRLERGGDPALKIRRWIEQTVHFDDSLERFDSALQAGRGVVLATAHIGNWELLGARLSPHVRSRGIEPVAVGLDRHAWLRDLRASYGVESLPQNTHPRLLRDVLAAGRPIALLADMEVRRLAGAYLPFFGTDALTMTAPAALARSAGCPILPARCTLPPGEDTYRIHFEPPLWIDEKLSRKAATLDLTRRLNSTYESWIRESPEQWAWYQPRWRTRPGTLEAIPLAARSERPDLPGAYDGDHGSH